MPYDAENSGEVKKMRSRLEKTYSSVSDTAARQAIHILNSMLESGKEEGAAWGAIHSKMKDRGLSKKTALEIDLERVAAKHPKHAKALLSIAKEASGWVPGELRDPIFDSGHVDLNPLDGREEGSQVPPERDSLGNEIDVDGNLIESIQRVPPHSRAASDDAWERLAKQTRG